MFDGKAFGENMVEIVKGYVGRQIAPIIAENKALRDRLDALEEMLRNTKALRYRGVYETGSAYDIGDTVTYAGSLWHCDRLTKSKPGEEPESWTLAVKKGRDAKGVARATA